MDHYGITFTFKTTCPKCGSRKQLKTVTDARGNIRKKQPCYKCGYNPPLKFIPKVFRGTWEPSSG